MRTKACLQLLKTLASLNGNIFQQDNRKGALRARSHDLKHIKISSFKGVSDKIEPWGTLFQGLPTEIEPRSVTQTLSYCSNDPKDLGYISSWQEN